MSFCALLFAVVIALRSYVICNATITSSVMLFTFKIISKLAVEVIQPH